MTVPAIDPDAGVTHVTAPAEQAGAACVVRIWPHQTHVLELG